MFLSTYIVATLTKQINITKNRHFIVNFSVTVVSSYRQQIYLYYVKISNIVVGTFRSAFRNNYFTRHAIITLNLGRHKQPSDPPHSGGYW